MKQQAPQHPPYVRPKHPSSDNDMTAAQMEEKIRKVTEAEQDKSNLISDNERKALLRKKYKELKSKPLSEASEDLPPVLIENILLQRRRILICGVSFGRKTWLCMLIAFCLSKGLSIFGRFKTEKIPVLYGNLELLEASAKRRFQAIAEALGYHGDPYENLRIISATEFTDIIEDDFADFLALQAADDKVKAVCVDPVWRLLGNREENSNTGIGQVLKPFSKFSREADASAIGVHHYAKGSGDEGGY
jgi:RecA-family ATPase